MLSRYGIRAGLPALLLGSGVACGSPPPSSAPTTRGPAPIATEAKEKIIDLSPVSEPPGLVVLARVNKPDSIVSAVGSWIHLPLPNGSELVRALTDDAVGDVVDLSQPIDGAVSVTLSRRGPEALFAFSVAVKGLDEAKVKLGERHRLVPGANGHYKVEGIGKSSRQMPPASARDGHGEQDDDEDDDDDTGCVLAPAVVPSISSGATPSSGGARLVCGSSAAMESLVPYLTRTMPREKWSSDVHVEVRPEPVRAPLSELRASLPILARSMMGSASPAVRDFVDASIGELVDVVNDAQKISFDGQIAESGVDVTTHFEFQANKSVFARVMTVADRADAPPQAFWHLPADTDTAFFGRGSDAKLFERPRELLANLLAEATLSSGMPEAERKAVRDLIADRMLALFTNGKTAIYAKGFDQGALEKVLKAKASLKADDTPGNAEAKKAVLEQVIGWHLYQVSEPVAKVGPIFKDWSTLWNRPAFAKWAQSRAVGSALPRMRIAPPPAGVALPNETVHLEVTVPRDDIDDERTLAPPSRAPKTDDRTSKKPGPAPAKPKKIHRTPVIFHLFAVPDGGATWLAFGIDAKLVAQKAAAALASAPDTNTLGKAPGQEVLREGKINGGGIATLRGLMVFAALDAHNERSVFSALGSLPHKGRTPLVFTGRGESPSATAKAGSATGTLRIPRAVIEDVVKAVMSAR